MAPQANCSHTQQGYCRKCPHYGYTQRQGYHLLAPNIRRRLPLSLISHATSPVPCFYDILAETSTNWVWAALASPPPDHQSTLPSNIQTVHLGQQLSPFEALPAELLYMIVAHLDRHPSKDLLSFGLTSPVFWPFLSQEIHLAYRATAPSLAGQELQFESTQRPSDTLPDTASSLLTKRTRLLSRLSSLCEWTMQDGSTIRAGADKNIKADLDFMIHFPQDRTWLLRNLTLRTYISSTALIGTGLTFHHILLCTISRLRGAFFGGGTTKEECGVWAGHRFDLVTEEAHRAQVETDAETGKAWEDSSEERVEFVKERVRVAMSAKEVTVAQSRGRADMGFLYGRGREGVPSFVTWLAERRRLGIRTHGE
ncbi:hypothetical protein K491DRAFT_710644 [Lophiostoma macrostomum CBS 122681]|uniref:F-box domain-containing protein n=1 Tax=Lophiostoma macrostomum CBS 122681 TaxID=1314788 RepID=A0A6A6TP42_9PLEO|nr:hypothetical protein K491DRAFT_710644 [Lophiostoma macrostomum CBS 122681]